MLNLANVRIDGNQTKQLCENLMMNKVIKYLYLRNNNVELIGSEQIAKLILSNKTLIEFDLFNCGFPEAGGTLIGAALKQNFCIEKLSIGENHISKKDIETIQLSVVFNTNYNTIKQSNSKYAGFAHNLIAEQLKKWASTS